jgi:O-antigen ligase
MVELGIPGFIAFVVFQLSLLWAGWRALKRPIMRRTPAFFLYVSLFAMIVGNYSQFLVSGQIYGDPFIASLLSIMIGAMLSSARILKDEPLPGKPIAPRLRRA